MLTIAVTTYNRKKILECMVRSFYDAEPSIPYRLMVYDDASDEYDEEYLRYLFPNATKVQRRQINVGADTAMKYMYKDFLNGEDEFFFSCRFRSNF